MDRGLNDEGFIIRAFNFKDEDYELEKKLLNQSMFDFDNNLSQEIKALLIASVVLYIKRDKLEENILAEVFEISTVQEARNFIDKYNEFTYSEQ